MKCHRRLYTGIYSLSSENTKLLNKVSFPKISFFFGFLKKNRSGLWQLSELGKNETLHFFSFFKKIYHVLQTSIHKTKNLSPLIMAATKRTTSDIEKENLEQQEIELKLLKEKLIHEDEYEDDDEEEQDLKDNKDDDEYDVALPTALFSKNSHRFALQAPNNHNLIKMYSIFDDLAQKDALKIKNLYNLDLNQDFGGDEILDMAWCDDDLSKIKDIATQKRKRRTSSASNNSSEKETIKERLQLLVETNQIFVCLFKSGSLVMYENEKIVNMIKLKSEVVSIKTFKNKIYVLDKDSMVRIFDTRTKKQLKSFTLVDGKNEDINTFHILKSSIESHEEAVELMLATDDVVYIINPSGRRPALIRKIELTGCFDLKHIPEKKMYVILTIDSIILYNYENEEIEKKWQFEGERLECCYNASTDKLYIVSFSLSHNSLFVFDSDYKNWVSNIIVKNSDIVEFQPITSSNSKKNNDSTRLIVSWLNINEPRFQIFELGEKHLDKTIIIDNLLPVEEMIIEDKHHNLEDKEKSQKHYEDEESKEKAREAQEKEAELKLANSSAIEKNKRFEELLQALKQNTPDFSSNDVVMKLVINQIWTEDLVKEFIVSKLDQDEPEDEKKSGKNKDKNSLIFFFYEKLAKHISSNPWQNNKNSCLFIKWILTMTNVFVSKKISPTINKTNKVLEKSLTQSTDTLSSLLSVQGKLEMLIAQEELRLEMGELISEDDDENEAIEDEEDTLESKSDNVIDAVLGSTSGKSNRQSDDKTVQIVDGEANED